MSLVPRCPNCDARVDPYGRDGGHSWCRKCREEKREPLVEIEHLGPGRIAL
jgi:tRNA(Ile2) C34 agmatinyltransferase TiaS